MANICRKGKIKKNSAIADNGRTMLRNAIFRCPVREPLCKHRFSVISDTINHCRKVDSLGYIFVGDSIGPQRL